MKARARVSRRRSLGMVSDQGNGSVGMTEAPRETAWARGEGPPIWLGEYSRPPTATQGGPSRPAGKRTWAVELAGAMGDDDAARRRNCRQPHEGSAMPAPAPAPPPSDRNLLFAVLAVQAGLVSRDRLFAAMQTWTLDKT